MRSQILISLAGSSFLALVAADSAQHRASSAISSYNAAKTTESAFMEVASLLGTSTVGTKSLVDLQNTLASSIIAQQTPAPSFFESEAGPYLLSLSIADKSVYSSALSTVKMKRQQTQTQTTATSAANTNTNTNAATTTTTGSGTQSTGGTTTTSGSASKCSDNAWAKVTDWISQDNCTTTSASPELGGVAGTYAALVAVGLGAFMLL